MTLKSSYAVSYTAQPCLLYTKHVFDMAKIRHAGSAYVAVSRCKSLDGLQILNFTKSAIVTDKHATQEMARLRDYTLPEYSLLPPRTSNNIRIVHLNVCGLQSHRLDLLSDQLLLEADILCFSETHLQSSDVLPSLSNFVIQIRQTTFSI